MNYVSLRDIRAAAGRLAGVVTRTPLIRPSRTPESKPFLLKPENLQPIGSFKIRGAYNAIQSISPEHLTKGVVAFSSGNHAQGVAYAAGLLGIPAWIVIEDSAPQIKVDATRALGADVIIAPMAERERVAQEIADRKGATLIPSFNHLDVMAGQGTIGLEIVEDCPDVAAVLVPVSGGGLASGVGAAIKSLRPEVKVYLVEPELAADTKDSLQAGHLVRWSPEDRQRSIADGLGGQPSELTFAHLRRFSDGIFTVREDELRDAVRWLAREARIVSEPAGAAATAAYLHHADDIVSGVTVAIVSGGNIEPALFDSILAERGSW